MTWPGLRWTLAFAATVAAGIGACGYPSFTYGPSGNGGDASTSSTTAVSSTSTGGQGGTGGTPSTSSSTVTSTSSNGGGGSGPTNQVSCGGDDGMQCDLGQICCVNNVDITCDKCFDSDTCEDVRPSCTDHGYTVYACDGDEDCPQAKPHCCAQIFMTNIVQKVGCYTNPCSDGTNTRQMCHGNDDCPPGYPDCSDFNYFPYLVCE